MKVASGVCESGRVHVLGPGHVHECGRLHIALMLDTEERGCGGFSFVAYEKQLHLHLLHTYVHITVEAPCLCGDRSYVSLFYRFSFWWQSQWHVGNGCSLLYNAVWSVPLLRQQPTRVIQADFWSWIYYPQVRPRSIVGGSSFCGWWPQFCVTFALAGILCAWWKSCELQW